MKKLLCVFAALACFAVSAFAVPTAFNESHEENWSDMTYVNIPILKILDGRESYVVIYQKNKVGVGEVSVPKRWTKGNKENPAKLKVRDLGRGKLKSYITIVKKNNEFYKVVLNVPRDKHDMVWGVVANGKEPDSSKETLEELVMN